MIDCQIVGDSVAVGIGSVMRECTVNAKVGIPLASAISRAAPHKLSIVSEGSNDPNNPNLAAILRSIRGRAGGRVIWILPQNRRAADVVRLVAGEHGDIVVGFVAGPDHVHPKSYQDLVNTIRSRVGG